MPERLAVEIGPADSVTALVYLATESHRMAVTLLLGHGAGVDQTSEFMVAFARGLARRGADTVTFNFPYTEHGRRVPDSPGKLEACFRAAVAAVQAHPRLAGNRLVIGGKSLGGRIASRIAAAGVERLAGLVYLGYPLHPPGKADQLRADHLPRIGLPMLFVQGSRDPFGTPEELQPIVRTLDPVARIHVVEGGDHSFAMPKRRAVPPQQVFERAQDEIARWLREDVPG